MRQVVALNPIINSSVLNNPSMDILVTDTDSSETNTVAKVQKDINLIEEFQHRDNEKNILHKIAANEVGKLESKSDFSKTDQSEMKYTKVFKAHPSRHFPRNVSLDGYMKRLSKVKQCREKPLFVTMARVKSELYWQLIENFFFYMYVNSCHVLFLNRVIQVPFRPFRLCSHDLHIRHILYSKMSRK